jgi:hypothetical protein
MAQPFGGSQRVRAVALNVPGSAVALTACWLALCSRLKFPALCGRFLSGATMGHASAVLVATHFASTRPCRFDRRLACSSVKANAAMRAPSRALSGLGRKSKGVRRLAKSHHHALAGSPRDCDGCLTPWVRRPRFAGQICPQAKKHLPKGNRGGVIWPASQRLASRAALSYWCRVDRALGHRE